MNWSCVNYAEVALVFLLILSVLMGDTINYIDIWCPSSIFFVFSLSALAELLAPLSLWVIYS